MRESVRHNLVGLPGAGAVARLGRVLSDPCRIRLEAQDTALSRRRSPVRIRYAVPPLLHGPDSCSNRADFGLMGDLEHPYQHPYALAIWSLGYVATRRRAQHVVHDPHYRHYIS